MKTAVKTVAMTLLAGVISFGVVNNVNAMSPKEQEAFGKANITATQALLAAQAKLGSDAKVKEIEFRHSPYGKDYFQVEMFANGQKHEVDVDAEKGEILGVESNTSKKINWIGDITPKISFTQAMENAIGKTGGKVSEANLKNRHGKFFYKIETITNGQELKVAVDADNGQIIDLPKRERKHKGRDKRGRREHGFRADSTITERPN